MSDVKRQPRSTRRAATAGIRTLKVRSEADQSLHYVFIIPLEDGSEKTLRLSQKLSIKALRRELRGYTEGMAQTEAQVQALIDSAPPENLSRVVEPGWKDGAFVTPAWSRGPRGSSYVWLDPEGEKIASSAGPFVLWRARVAEPCAQSSYLAFGLMLGLRRVLN